MAVTEYKPSHTWPSDAGRDENDVLGTDASVIGDENDSARALLTLLAGREPIDRIVRTEYITLSIDARRPLHLRVYQANDLLVRLTLIDEKGGALKIGGASFLFVARGLNGEVIRKTSETGDIAVIDLESAEVGMVLTSSDTNLAPSQYRCEFLLTDVEGARYTVGRGLLSILDSLTAGR